jgi:hypothetical protein
MAVYVDKLNLREPTPFVHAKKESLREQHNLCVSNESEFI